MSTKNDVSKILRGLENRGYHPIAPPAGHLAAYSKPGALGNTYVISLCELGYSSMGPAETMMQSEPWFRSKYGNNGNGLLLFIYPDTPAWAADEVKQSVGSISGGIVDPWSSFRWISSTLGWDGEID